MTVLVSIDCDKGIVKRFDATKPEGLTHCGRLQIGREDSPFTAAEIIESFRVSPPADLEVNGQTRLLPPPAALSV